MAIIDIKRTVSLDGAIMPVALEGTLYGGENQAHRFIINATKDGTALSLTGTVTASFLRKADDAEVVLTGEIIGGGAAVTLAQSCYTQPGRFELTIFLTQNGSKTALYSCNGNVRNTSASEIVDPGHVVPDISDIVAEYARMQAASDAAEAAAENANEAAQFATDDEWTNGDTLQTGRVYQTLHMANFEEETAGQYLRVISGNVAQAERVNQSGWSVYRYDLPHRMLIRLESIEKNTPTVQGVLPMAAVLTSGSTETLYSLDSDRTGTYILADALLVNYNTTLNASAIKNVSITAVANRQYEDVIVCLDHAADFDKIVVFGDSIFANYINSTTVGNGVMAQFASLMGLPVVNNAVGGATLSTMQTSPKNVVQQVQDYIASATPGGTPLYMIDGGTNDQYNNGAGLANLGQYTDGVNGITNTIYGATYRIINDLLGFGAQPWQIVITTPIPKGIRGDAAYVATMDAQLTAIAGAMAEIAMVQQCNVINGYGAPFDNLTTDTAKAIIMPDDTHPSVQGAKMYAERIFRLLGVANQREVTSLKSALIVPEFTWHVGGYVNSSGVIVTTDGQATRSAYTDLILVQQGDLIDASNLPEKDNDNNVLSCTLTFYNNGTFIPPRINARSNNGRNTVPASATGLRVSFIVNVIPMTSTIIENYFNVDFYLKAASYEDWFGTDKFLLDLYDIIYANRDPSSNNLRVITQYYGSPISTITDMPRWSYIYKTGADLQPLLDDFPDKLLSATYYVVECMSLSLTGSILLYHVYALDYSKEWRGVKNGDNNIVWRECDVTSNTIIKPNITWDIGKYIADGGAIVDSDGYASRSAITNFISVQQGDIIDNSDSPLNDGNGHAYTCWLNLYKNGVWDKRENILSSRIQVIPVDVTEIRFSFNIQTYTMTDEIIASGFKTKFYLKPASYEEMMDINESVNDVKTSESIKQVAVFPELGWVYGYLGTTANSGIGYSNKNTIVCPQYIFAKSGTIFSSLNNYRFNVRVYTAPDNSAPIDISTLDTSDYTMRKDGFVRLTVAKPSDSESLEITDMYDAAAHITTNAPTYILNPIIYKDVFPPEIITRTQEVFVQAMNEKAAQIGMTNSIFADTYGENTAISRVTARDMVRMGVEACSYNELCRVWQTNEKTITTFDSARREIFCQYGNEGERTNLETLEESYPVLGKKNGYMPLSGDNKIFTMVAVCVVDGKIVVGSLGILGTMSAADGRAQRPVAMKELMDNVKAIMDGGSASTPTYYNYGCAAELPVGNPAMYERKDLNWLYEYNPDTQFAPASCTKVMTAMVMLDYVTDIHAKFKVLNAPSGGLLKGTDILSYEQALYLMMLPSNGTACYAVARAVGTQMITAYS